MRILLISLALVLSNQVTAQTNHRNVIHLQPLLPEDMPIQSDRPPHGADCEISLDSPLSQDSLSGPVLLLLDSVDSSPIDFITIRVNGKPQKLAADLNHKWGQVKHSLRGAWANDAMRVVLLCSSSSSTESGSTFIGSLEIKMGKHKRIFKVRGFCGC